MEAFAHPGDGRLGCLLIHGLTGTPEEVHPLGEHLARLGYATEAPMLPGHGTSVDDLRRVTWRDWYAGVLSAWDRLGERTSERRFVAGVSMGALLSLHLAHERADEVAGAALLAPALTLRAQSRAEHAVWLSRLPWLPRALEILDKGKGRRTSKSYSQVAMRAVGELVRLQRTVRAELSEIRVPTLILEGGEDLTVAVGTGEVIERALGATVKRRLLYPTSFHILTEGDNASAVVNEIAAFFADRADERIPLPQLPE